MSAAPDTKSSSGKEAHAKSADIKNPLFGPNPFRDYFPLEEWIKSYIAEPGLWDALKQAIATRLTRQEHPCGLVFADDPLIGLATVAALGGDVMIPVRSREESPAAANRLDEFLMLGESSVRMWQRSFQGVDPQGKTFLMRAWGHSDHDALAKELAQPDSSRPDVICLLQGPRKSSCDLYVLADMSRLIVEILEDVLTYLNLPTGIPENIRQKPGQLLPRMLERQGIAPVSILHSVNSSGYEEFERLAWAFHESEEGSDELRKLVLNEHENAPRHAASLFVAAHFPPLPPDIFFELADLLTEQTPSYVPGRNEGRPPSQVTDKILTECGIKFIPRDGMKRAVIHSSDPRCAWKPDAQVKHLFKKYATLLVERYLLTLAHRLTLGHPSEEVVESYQDMEVDALRALSRDQARERLRRIVFGYPVAAAAGDGFRDAHRRTLDASLLRAARRTPAFLKKLFPNILKESNQPVLRDSRVGAKLTLTDAVAALCTSLPVDNDVAWEEEFDKTAARLFWYAYAADPVGVTLRGFPPLFDQGDNMRPEERRRRRRALIDRLRECLNLRTEGDRADSWSLSLQQPQTLTRALHDVANQLTQMVQSNLMQAEDLLVELACQYLFRVVRKSLWTNIQTWPSEGDTESLPIRGLLSDRFRQSLDPAVRYFILKAQAISAAGQGADGTVLVAEGYRTWLLALGALDCLVGSGSFGADLETSVATAFMFDDKLDDAAIDGPLQRAVAGGLFSSTWIWERLCDPERVISDEDLDENKWKRFQELTATLWKAIPILLLMAAARVADKEPPQFAISPATRQFLTHHAVGLGAAPLDGLLDDILELQKLQRTFRDVLGKWQAPASVLNEWYRSLGDRETALRSFRKILEPLRRDLNQSLSMANSTSVPQQGRPA